MENQITYRLSLDGIAAVTPETPEVGDGIFPPEVGAEIVRRWGDDVLAKMETLGFGFDADVESADAAE
jgi:hypothetical protein